MEKLVLNNDILFAEVIDMLGRGKRVTIPVKGSSMLPFIREDKDLVILEGVCSGSPEHKDVSVGDIVLFRYRQRYILHRISRIEADKVIIQGDGNCYQQEVCTKDDIYGRVVTILRNKKDGLDPYSARQKRYSRLWDALQPFRRYILAIYRRIC